MAADSDVPSPPSSPPHRTATVSAAAALQNGGTHARRSPLSTGLAGLDELLQDPASGRRPSGGLTRGQLTEFYGPPGSGKTALAIEASAKALKEGHSVIWLDTAGKVCGPRLSKCFERHHNSREPDLGSQPSPAQSCDELLERFHHFSVPTLPHLLALLSPSSARFPRPETSLVIVDSISSILDAAYPSHHDVRANPTAPKETLKWARSRKWDVITDVLGRLAYLAATYDVAVLLLSQTIVERDDDQEKLLRPIFDFRAWNESIRSRIVLFRDFIPDEGNDEDRDGPIIAHVAALTKSYQGAYAIIGDKVWFNINERGLRQLACPSPEAQAATAQETPRQAQIAFSKRPQDGEIADSQSEDESPALDDDIDWVEEDAALERRDRGATSGDGTDHLEEVVGDDGSTSERSRAVWKEEPSRVHGQHDEGHIEAEELHSEEKIEGQGLAEESEEEIRQDGTSR